MAERIKWDELPQVAFLGPTHNALMDFLAWDLSPAHGSLLYGEGSNKMEWLDEGVVMGVDLAEAGCKALRVTFRFTPKEEVRKFFSARLWHVGSFGVTPLLSWNTTRSSSDHAS